MRLNRNIFFLAWLLLSSSLFGQYVIKNYLNFLPKKNTPFTTITQDKNGYLWFGSKDGLVKFDGKTSSFFTKKNGYPLSYITSIYSDNDLNIWIGTSTSKVYRLSKNAILDSLAFTNQAPDTKITGFYKNGNKLYIATYGNGIYTFSNSVQTEHLTSSNGLSDNVIYSINRIGDKLYCGTDAGISIIQNLDAKLSFDRISNEDGLPDNIVRWIKPYSNSKLVLGMQDSGICYLNLQSKKIERIPTFNNWKNGPVLSCNTLSDGGLAFAIEKKGICILENNKLHSEEFSKELKTTSFDEVFFDRSGSIWATSNIGIHQIIEKRFEFINASKGLTNEKNLSVVADQNNSIWVGTLEGITKISKDASNMYVFETPKNFQKASVSCSAIDKDGTLFFGTFESGLVVIKNSKLLSFSANNSDLKSNSISGVFIHEGKIYISTLGDGFFICELNGEKLSVFKKYSENDGLKSNYVYCAIINNKNELLIASDGGTLEKIENSTIVSLADKLKLKSNTIYSLAKDSKGNIWAVTNTDGVIKYDGNNVTIYRTNNGLRDEQPQQIIEHKGSMYLVHPKGIDKIDIATNEVRYYDVMDGDFEPNLNSIIINGNMLYSATNNGVLAFRVESTKADSIKPIVLITKLSVNYVPYSIDSISTFKWNQRNITIEFNGIWTKNPDKLQYRYQLKGYDSEWKFTTMSQILNYNNLDAGTYTFVVQSKNEEDIWSDTAQYSFSIALPIWKRWWFWILSILIVALVFFRIIKWRTNALKKENIALDKKVAERTTEIEKQTKIIAEANKELERLSIVASKTDNVVIILKPDGEIEYVNESFQKLNRITLDEILKQKLNIFTSSNNSRIHEFIKEAVATKKSIKYESLNEKNPDNKVWEASTLTPIFDENDHLKKFIIIDSDITESKKQQAIIEQKNKDITDSIEYARKIQTAILPTQAKISKYLPNSFVFYKTKDIVSGDFYWFSEQNDFCIIAAVDCTGHGVPGAFMSLIGYNILNRIVNENKITDPSLILKNLNLGVIETLSADSNNSQTVDGMDAAICKIYTKENKIEYAGAMRPLWIVNNGELTEIKADKTPIGTKQDPAKPEITYTLHTIVPQPTEVFYIFTDGYADQFGGDKDKKMGSARFKELLISIHKNDFNKQRETLYTEHVNWKRQNEQVDDLCVIGFKK